RGDRRAGEGDLDAGGSGGQRRRREGARRRVARGDEPLHHEGAPRSFVRLTSPRLFHHMAKGYRTKPLAIADPPVHRYSPALPPIAITIRTIGGRITSQMPRRPAGMTYPFPSPSAPAAAGRQRRRQSAR